MPTETAGPRADDGRRFWIWGGRFRSVAHACAARPAFSDVVDEHVRIGPLTRADAEREWQALARRGVDTAAYRVLVSDAEPPPLPWA